MATTKLKNGDIVQVYATNHSKLKHLVGTIVDVNGIFVEVELGLRITYLFQPEDLIKFTDEEAMLWKLQN